MIARCTNSDCLPAAIGVPSTLEEATVKRSVPRMATIQEVAKKTGISEYAIRKLIKRNEIIYVKSGVKYLVNFDRFLDYLNGQ